MSLVYRERPAAGDPAGLLILHHGRGADEHDLLGLADVLDPQRRLHVVTPRAPLTLPGWPGYHWYTVPRVGYPDPDDVPRAPTSELAAFHDETWERTGIAPGADRARRVLDGLGDELRARARRRAARLRPGSSPSPASSRPSRAGSPTSARAPQLPVFIAHGRRDPIMDVELRPPRAASCSRRPGCPSATTSRTPPTTSTRPTSRPPPAGWPPPRGHRLAGTTPDAKDGDPHAQAPEPGRPPHHAGGRRPADLDRLLGGRARDAVRLRAAQPRQPRREPPVLRSRRRAPDHRLHQRGARSPTRRAPRPTRAACTTSPSRSRRRPSRRRSSGSTSAGSRTAASRTAGSWTRSTSPTRSAC